MWEKLFRSDFMPHGMCYMWEPGLVWLHVISDALIFLAYISIPVTLVYILKIRSDLIFSKITALFGAFVLLCGFTHLIAVYTVWNGAYWFSGTVKSITALVSVATAYMLWKLVPTLKEIPTVEKLKIEVEKREAAEALLTEKAKKLEQESKKLASVNDELKAFAYASSHDLKSPLRGIKQLASWIEEDLEDEGMSLPEDSQEHFTLLKSRITRMERLLDDLLEYSKAGHATGDLKEVDVKEHSTELFELLNTKTKAQLHLAQGLPTFNTLEQPFSLVLRNILDNALKHSDKNAGNVWVDVEEQSDFYLFKITDDGPGVSPEDFDKIVKIFSTLKPKDEVEGSGMGLAIINKIVQRVGGELSFECSEGKGLTVKFTWPKQRAIESLKELDAI